MKRIFKALLASVGFAALGSSPVLAQTETAGVSPEQFEQALGDTDNWRIVDPANLIIMHIKTYDGQDRGTVYIETADFAAPNHVKQFKAIIESGDFNQTIFHRVIDDFMAQGGDVEMIRPNKKWPSIGQEFVFKRTPGDADSDIPPAQLLGNPLQSRLGYINGFPIGTQVEGIAALVKGGQIESWIRHCPGTVSTARTNDPNSADTQFFLMRHTAEHLDKTYTAWGRVLVGLDVVRSIKKGDDEGGSVLRADILSKAVLASTLPEGERPRVIVQRTDGPEFAAFLQTYTGGDICDLPSVPALISE